MTYITIWLDEYHYVFCYLSLVMDAYTEEIVGWSVGPTLETSYPIEALKMAMKRIEGKNDIELIHHSDRGCQYASSEYVRLLERMNIRISMTESGDPKDNDQAERINNTMKNELLKDMRFNCIEEVMAAVSNAVDFYNNDRPHMSIDMMTPAQAAKHNGEITKRWFSYRTQAIKNNHSSLEITEKRFTFADASRVSFRATPSSQPLSGIRTWKTTIIRNNKNKSTNNSYKSNQSQLISGKDSKRSQPKSGNDNVPRNTRATGRDKKIMSLKYLGHKRGRCQTCLSISQRVQPAFARST
jgi:hypothetical protein